MQPQRETITDNLADIIQVLHIGYKSGMLTVERGEGHTREEGVIVFMHGRVVEAKAGQQNGLAAFNYLNRWQKCRFSFVDHPGYNTSPSLPSTQPLTPAPGGTSIAKKSYSDTETLMNTNTTGTHHGTEKPSRSRSGEVALQHPENFQLPRTHRRLLLLINGQRNVYELARLMVRNPEDVQILLNELEQSGFIQQ